MRVEPQALESDIVGMEIEDRYDVSAGDSFRKSSIGEEKVAYGGFRVGLV